jgi:hypothetical protein
MNPFYILIPLVVVLATVTYGVVRALGRIWLDHRIRLALLDKLQEKPELLESYTELQRILANLPEGRAGRPRQDYALTGVVLAAIGIGCAVAGQCSGAGRLAVGLYVGGWICIVLGVILALIGIFIRRIARNLVSIPRKD